MRPWYRAAMANAAMIEAVSELEVEHRALEALLRELGPDGWGLPTPATGWDVRDQVCHLADFDEVAHDTATGGPRQLNEEALSYPSPEEYTETVRRKGFGKSAEEMIEWYAGNAERLRAAFLAKEDPKERVPWGLGMSVRTLVTARLMEHWAHGLDVRAAVGEAPNASPRLRSIAWLVFQAVPYAFQVARVTPPERSLRAELTFDGERWTFGPTEADDVITGNALDFCRVGVQRLRRADAPSLVASGPLADMALDHLRAYL